MARKLVFGDFTATHTLKIHKDTETCEYVVHIYTKYPEHCVAEYFSDDYKDAKGSGQHMLRHATANNVQTPLVY